MSDVAWAIKFRPSKDDDTWWWVGLIAGNNSPIWANRALFLSYEEASDEAWRIREDGTDARLVRVTRCGDEMVSKSVISISRYTGRRDALDEAEKAVLDLGVCGGWSVACANAIAALRSK